MLEKSQESKTSVNYVGLRAIDHEILGFLGLFEHYSVWCTSCPKTLGFFEHCGVSMHTSSHDPNQKNAKIWMGGVSMYTYIYR